MSFEWLDMDHNDSQEMMAKQNGHSSLDMPSLKPPPWFGGQVKASGLEGVSLAIGAKSAVTVTDEMVSKIGAIAKENLRRKDLLKNVNNQLRDKVKEMQWFRDAKHQSSQKETRLMTEVKSLVRKTA